MKNLNVVIDTNVFLVIVPTNSKYHWLYEAIRDNRLHLLISSEIILEYEEQFGLRYKIDVTNQLLETLTLKKNVTLITPYFNWSLINADTDDNKFVDCAIAGNADYIITHDSHFGILKSISFPKVNVVRIDEFEQIFKQHSDNS
jgi:putative PIN family toxin of toxin-antitoxin system